MTGGARTRGTHETLVILNAFQRAITREAHNLAHRPDLLWQQLANRLLWEDDPVPQLVSAAQSRAPGRWIHSRTPPHESEALLFTLEGHERTPRFLAIAPDGSFVISGGDEETLVVWDLVEGIERIRLGSGGSGWPEAQLMFGCEMSPDGRWVVAYGADARLRMWDTATGAELYTLEGHEAYVRGCVISPEGTFVVSSSDDATLRVWDPLTGSCTGTLRGHEGSVKGCAIAPDGKWIVSADSDATLRTWEAHGGKRLRVIECDGPGFDACEISPDGRFILTWDDSTRPFSTAQTRVWDARSGAQCYAFPGSGGWAFLPQGRELVLGHKGGELVVHDLRTGDALRTFGEHAGLVTACATSPDGAALLTASSDGTLRIWDAQTTELRAELEGHAGRVWDSRFTPDGQWIVSCADDDTLKVWDLQRAGQDRPRSRHGVDAAGGSITSVNFSPEGKTIASGGWDGKVKLWDCDSGDELRTLDGHVPNQGSLAIISACEFLPDGTTLVSAARGCPTPVIWGLDGGDPAPVTLAGELESLDACALSSDGTFMVALDSVEWLQGWDLVTRRSWPRLETRLQADHGLCVSSDGSFAAGIESNWDSEGGVILRTGGGEGWVAPRRDRVLLYDIQRGTLLAALAPQTGVEDFAIGPDARLIASAGDDGIVRLWEVDGGREVGALRGHEGRVESCTIGPDGRLLVSVGADDTLRFWDLESGHELQRVQGGSPRCAVTPDGRMVVSRRERTLNVWEVASGDRVASVPMRGHHAFALHPWQPVIACGDSGGVVSILEFLGVEYGPIVVTAVDPSTGPRIRCPKCRETFPLEDEWLAAVIQCPTGGCAQRLRVSPFVVRLRPVEHPDATQVRSSAPPPSTSRETPDMDLLMQMLGSMGQTRETKGDDPLTRMQNWAEGERPKRGWFKRRRRR